MCPPEIQGPEIVSHSQAGSNLVNNSEVWGQYKSYTRDITEFSRKLGFAGVATCWVLKSADDSLPGYVLWALGFFVLFFISDILQGLVAALVLRRWIRSEEIELHRMTGKIEGEYNKPQWLDYPAFTLFLLKVSFLLIGFLYIGFAIIGKQM